ncbi:MAG: GNAT family N-acetyltransferase [Clostridiales bacterium]|nr:GNAT family N-acetyltransferase [Clostridiales bacterium]
MVVKVYDNAKLYLAENEATLLEQESVSQLVLYNAYQIEKKTLDSKSQLGVVVEDDETILHFSNRPLNNMAIYIYNESKDIKEAAMLLADYMSDNKIHLEGLNARQEVCEAFIEQYRKSVKSTFTEKMAMDIMEIRQVNEVKGVEGKTRLAMPDEAMMMTEWLIQFQIESLTKEIDYESALVKITKLIDDNKLYVFEDTKETVVSMAAATRQLVNGIAINYVYTPEEYRGMGYAAANVYNISKKYLDDGFKFCTLFVDKKNVLSKRAYEKVGYETVDEMYEYKLLQVSFT